MAAEKGSHLLRTYDAGDAGEGTLDKGLSLHALQIGAS